jgi:hypothetical protein
MKIHVAEQKRQHREQRRHDMHHQPVDGAVAFRPSRGIGEQEKKTEERQTRRQQGTERSRGAKLVKLTPSPNHDERREIPQQMPVRLRKQARDRC